MHDVAESLREIPAGRSVRNAMTSRVVSGWNGSDVILAEDADPRFEVVQCLLEDGSGGEPKHITWGVLDRDQSRTSGSVVTHTGFETEQDARREAKRLAAE
jgi:hypothetical protein